MTRQKNETTYNEKKKKREKKINQPTPSQNTFFINEHKENAKYKLFSCLFCCRCKEKVLQILKLKIELGLQFKTVIDSCNQSKPD